MNIVIKVILTTLVSYRVGLCHSENFAHSFTTNSCFHGDYTLLLENTPALATDNGFYSYRFYPNPGCGEGTDHILFFIRSIFLYSHTPIKKGKRYRKTVSTFLLKKMVCGFSEPKSENAPKNRGVGVIFFFISHKGSVPRQVLYYCRVIAVRIHRSRRWDNTPTPS